MCLGCDVLIHVRLHFVEEPEEFAFRDSLLLLFLTMLLASETCLDNTFSGLMVRSDRKTVTDICVSVTVM